MRIYQEATSPPRRFRYVSKVREITFGLSLNQIVLNVTTASPPSMGGPDSVPTGYEPSALLKCRVEKLTGANYLLWRFRVASYIGPRYDAKKGTLTGSMDLSRRTDVAGVGAVLHSVMPKRAQASGR